MIPYIGAFHYHKVALSPRGNPICWSFAQVQAMSIRKAVILSRFYNTPNHLSIFKCIEGLLPETILLVQNPNNTIPRLCEITLRLLKKPLVICLTLFLPGTIAVSASNEIRTYWDSIPLNRCLLIGLGFIYKFCEKEHMDGLYRVFTLILTLCPCAPLIFYPLSNLFFWSVWN